MRRNRKPKPKDHPWHGQLRRRRVFLWLPRRVDGRIKWLRFVHVIERWECCVDGSAWWAAVEFREIPEDYLE